MYKNVKTNWIAVSLLGIGPIEILMYVRVYLEGENCQSLAEVVLAIEISLC